MSGFPPRARVSLCENHKSTRRDKKWHGINVLCIGYDLEQVDKQLVYGGSITGANLANLGPKNIGKP